MIHDAQDNFFFKIWVWRSPNFDYREKMTLHEVTDRYEIPSTSTFRKKCLGTSCIKSILLGSFKVAFEPSRTSILDFGSDFMSVRHWIGRHFCPVIIRDSHIHILEKNCLGTSWNTKSMLLESFKAILSLLGPVVWILEGILYQSVT